MKYSHTVLEQAEHVEWDIGRVSPRSGECGYEIPRSVN
jgi:hypothetical protein